MTTMHRLLAAIAITALSACSLGSGDSSADRARPTTGDYEVMIPAIPDVGPPEAQGPSPMPDLAARVERVVAELGSSVDDVQASLSATPGSRRHALHAIGAPARASLRRHNVRVEQLARFLKGNVQ